MRIMANTGQPERVTDTAEEFPKDETAVWYFFFKKSVGDSNINFCL